MVTVLAPSVLPLLSDTSSLLDKVGWLPGNLIAVLRPLLSIVTEPYKYLELHRIDGVLGRASNIPQLSSKVMSNREQSNLAQICDSFMLGTQNEVLNCYKMAAQDELLITRLLEDYKLQKISMVIRS